jgi:predicted ArsR family transcriptional regulator
LSKRALPERGVRLAAVSELTDAKRRIVETLKRIEGATASELAEQFGLTDTAVRQHLDGLEQLGLVSRHAMVSEGRGRPPVRWVLTPAAAELFPDRHADLTVDLIESIRTALGDDALDAVVRTRAERQLAAYQAALPQAVDIELRVRNLAELRSTEGYLAEWSRDGDQLVLTEHHCPIHDAAATCPSLCGAELELFRSTLGPEVSVERDQHVFDGHLRCSYRITPTPPEGPRRAR